MKKIILSLLVFIAFISENFSQSDSLLLIPSYQIDSTIVVSTTVDSTSMEQEKKSLYLEAQYAKLRNLNVTRKIISRPLDEKIEPIKISIKKKKSLSAATYSFLLPGAGQLYNESYITSAIFVVVEIAAIIYAVKYDSKGNNQTKKFQKYADENWSPVKYARFTVNNIARILAITNPSKNHDDLEVYKVFNSDGSLNWYHLNRIESEIGGYYSHRLALPGEQQYYEMIGKYAQFNPGWKEFPDTLFFKYGDPLTSQFLYYAKMRGKANDFYSVASTFVKIIVTNHFFSALEAAYGSYLYNKNYRLYLTLEPENTLSISDVAYKTKLYFSLKF
jgi:hypothetical protein